MKWDTHYRYPRLRISLLFSTNCCEATTTPGRRLDGERGMSHTKICKNRLEAEHRKDIQRDDNRDAPVHWSSASCSCTFDTRSEAHVCRGCPACSASVSCSAVSAWNLEFATKHSGSFGTFCWDQILRSSSSRMTGCSSRRCFADSSRGAESCIVFSALSGLQVRFFQIVPPFAQRA